MPNALPLPLSSPAPSPSSMIVEAARCWRGERDRGGAPQPGLYAVLARYGCEMLSPVLDSLMTLVEAALGRRLATGEANRLSDDEALLLRLLDGTAVRENGMRSTLDGAVRSTRIMMRLALGQRLRIA